MRKHWLTDFDPDEKQYLDKGIALIGVDEVNVFSSLQPIIVGAVKIVPPVKYPLVPVADCKVLTVKERKKVALSLMERFPVYVDYCDFHIVDGGGNYRRHELDVIRSMIDRIIGNNGNAVVFVDYYDIDGLRVPQFGVYGGDETHYSIAAASIIARYVYDEFRRMFVELFGYKYSGGFSKQAIDEMRSRGLTIFHRRSWINNSCKKRGWPIITKENRDREKERCLLEYLSKVKQGIIA